MKSLKSAIADKNVVGKNCWSGRVIEISSGPALVSRLV